MNEQITTLLREESRALAVPEPDTGAILRSGRRRRHRRTAARATGTLAVVGILVAVTLALRPGSGSGEGGLTPQERFDAASPTVAYGDYGAFSSGNVVYVGNNRVKFEDRIKALYYTSAGVLVRAGRSQYTDSSGPSRYTLIRPDGEVSSVPLKMGDRVPGTDIDSPNVAYGAPTGDPKRWDLVVTDVTTGREVARTTVTGTFTWGGWEAPPVSLHGDRMWAHFDNGWLEYDWRSGETRMVPDSESVYETEHGRYAAVGPTDWTVRDWESGEAISRLPMTKDDYGFFSPDGRFLRTFDQMAGINQEEGDEPPAPKIFDVESGTSRVLSRGADQYGWTPDGKVLIVDARGDALTTCDAATGSCETVQVAIEDHAVKLGGNSYES